jgi:hypothetical protein
MLAKAFFVLGAASHRPLPHLPEQYEAIIWYPDMVPGDGIEPPTIAV